MSSFKPKKPNLDSARKPNLDTGKNLENRKLGQQINESRGSLWQQISQSLRSQEPSDSTINILNSGYQSRGFENGNKNTCNVTKMNDKSGLTPSSASFRKKNRQIVEREDEPQHQYMLGNMMQTNSNLHVNSQNKPHSQRKMNSFRKSTNNHQVSLQENHNQEVPVRVYEKPGHSRYNSNLQKQRKSETFDFDNYQVSENQGKHQKRCSSKKPNQFNSVCEQSLQEYARPSLNPSYTLQKQKVSNIESQIQQIIAYLNSEREINKEVVLRESNKIKQLEKVIKENKQQYQGYLNNLVQKLNQKMGASERRITHFEQQIVKNDRKAEILDQRVTEFMVVTKQKIQEITIQIDAFIVGTHQIGFKKSKVGMGYSVNLKSSVNNLQQMSLQTLQQFKNQIESLKSQVKGMQIKVEQKQLLKVEMQKKQFEKPQVQIQKNVRTQSMQKLTQQCENLRKYVESRLSQQKNMIANLEQNQQMMNQSFQRCVNFQIAKKIQNIQKQVHDILQKTPIVIQEILTRALDQKTSKYKILKIRQTNQMEKDKLDTKCISYKETYLLDEEGYLLDSRGVYLTDQAKQKIKIYEDQIYLLQIQGIQILEAK